jgi:signal transduction histidine kinase
MSVAVAVLAAIAIGLGFLWARAHGRVRRLREERAAAEAASGEAAQARDAFFDLATHELRSPLSAILGYQELLEDGAYGDLGPALDPVQRIGRSATHLLHLIDGVIELSRLRAGSVRPEAGPVDLGVLMSSIAEGFRTHAQERSIEPHVTLPGKLPTIRSDQERLVRALDLLVTSALKHPAGSSLGFDVHDTADGVTVRLEPTDIEVRDAGDDPAVRLGIRLAVADALARLLGGSLDIRSGPDGSIASLTLRIRDLDRL